MTFTLSDLLWGTLALVLILEGLAPFISPQSWRETMLRLASQPDPTLRLLGLIAISVGVVIFWMLDTF